MKIKRKVWSGDTVGERAEQARMNELMDSNELNCEATSYPLRFEQLDKQFKMLILGPDSSRLVFGMPFYLCENCARDNVKLDLTYAGINQMWLRTSPNPDGFGPPCDFCNNPTTIYQVQIVGTKFDTENLHLEKMKAELKPTA